MIASPRPIEDPARRHGVALAVALILLVSTALRLWQLSTPAEYMFDEIYYAKDGKAIVDGRVGPEPPLRWAAGDEVSWPHPEMGKFADRRRHPAVRRPRLRLAAAGGAGRGRAARLRVPAGTDDSVSPRRGRCSRSSSPPRTRWASPSHASPPSTSSSPSGRPCAPCSPSATSRTAGAHAGSSPAGAAGGMAVATKWSGALAIIAAGLIIVVAWILQARAARRDERTRPRRRRRAAAAGRGFLRGVRSGDSARGVRRAPRPRRARGARRRPARHLPLQLRAVLRRGPHARRLPRAAPADGDLQPEPQSHAHLRVRGVHVDRRLPPGVVLLRGQEDLPRRGRHRKPVPLVARDPLAGSALSFSRCCAAPTCCCRPRRSSSCCTCPGSRPRGRRSCTT